MDLLSLRKEKAQKMQYKQEVIIWETKLQLSLLKIQGQKLHLPNFKILKMKILEMNQKSTFKKILMDQIIYL